MNRMTRNLSNIFMALALACTVAHAGCGSNARQPVRGTVTLDGQPLPEGEIVFTPKAGTISPTAGAIIRDGAFSVSPINEKFAGTFRVEITASRPTGQQIKGPRGESIDELVNYIPARYNTASELVEEVKSNGPNIFDFPLQSK